MDRQGGRPVLFQVWGCRGGRNTIGSRIGNWTSCYSVAAGTDLFVFDAGKGLLVLAASLATDARLRGIERVHLLVTHAHMDHWEGLKDAEWMWRKNNGLAVTVLAPAEALDAIRRAHEPPSFVPLEVLALGTVGQLSFVELAAGKTVELPGATVDAVALHHYSGVAPTQHHLDTLGYRLAIPGGPAVAYLSDHEPTADTRAREDEVVSASHLAIVDANYADIAEHAFGHGSIEYAAQLARRFPDVRVLAAHHGPLATDARIEDAARRHGAGCARFGIAIEGRDEEWDAGAGAFVASSRG